MFLPYAAIGREDVLLTSIHLGNGRSPPNMQGKNSRQVFAPLQKVINLGNMMYFSAKWTLVPLFRNNKTMIG